MSIERLSLFNNKNDQRYHKVWIAAINPKEFQRLVRFENCENISIPSICDEITLKLNEEAARLVAIDLELNDEKPFRSFFLATQFFIGLIYVHEQQVKFLYDLASRFTVPTKFLAENLKNVPNSDVDDGSNDSPKLQRSKKALKRKSSTKVQRNIKRKISLNFDTSDERDDVETSNAKTMQLLQSAVVSNNSDISIRETTDEPNLNELNEPVYFCDLQYNDDTIPERSDFEDAILEDNFMPMTLNHGQSGSDVDNDIIGVPANILESTRRRSRSQSIGFGDTIYGQPDVEATETLAEESVAMDAGPPTMIEPVEVDIFDTITSLEMIDGSSRKRKRLHPKQPPLKDISLTINVKENVKTVSTTQRHLNPKDDSVSKTACLANLSRKIFDKPTHSVFSESMARQFEPRSMSDKLLQSFKRMTLTTTENTNRDLVQEFYSDSPSDDQRADASRCLPIVENSVVVDDVPPPPHHQETDTSQQSIDVPLDGCVTQQLPPSLSMVEQTTASFPVVKPPTIHQHEPVELSPAVRQILANNQTVTSFTRYETDSQKLFASRSRQNKLDWGTEGVLQKLLSLWNMDVYPIGMKEIMHSNNQRMSAATAFFSVMELNSTRIGLIHITKTPNTNVIFNIAKSEKLIELQQQTAKRF